MNYTCHKLGGVTATAITGMYAYQQNYTTTYQLFEVSNYPKIPLITCFGILGIFAILGSIIPDIDHPSSVIGKSFFRISRRINRKFGHRGITHYPLSLVVVSLVFIIIFNYIDMPLQVKSLFFWGSTGFVVGWLSHIILDTFNSRGVQLFAPFSKVSIKIPTGVVYKNKRIKWKYLRGDSLFDNILLLLGCFFLLQISYNAFL